MMTNRQYDFCVAEAANYPDVYAYVSDISLSSVFEDDPEAPIPEERTKTLAEIWRATRRTFREIAGAAHLTPTELGRRFSIPGRTASAWATGERPMPVYLSLAMQEALGIYSVPRGEQGDTVPVTAVLSPAVYAAVERRADDAAITPPEALASIAAETAGSSAKPVTRMYCDRDGRVYTERQLAAMAPARLKSLELADLSETANDPADADALPILSHYTFRRYKLSRGKIVPAETTLD